MLELQVIGHLGQDSKVFQSNGKSYISFSVASKYREKSKEGTMIESTQWVDCTMNHSKIFEDNLKKGKQVFVRGKFAVKLWSKEERSGISISCWVDSILLL